VNWTGESLPDQRNRSAVITGANSGIGWFTALALARAGAHVVLACRDIEKAKGAAGRITAAVAGADVSVAEVDLASIESVQSFAYDFDGPLDLLINNAGVMAPPRFTTTSDGYELQFGTNHLAHFVLTGLLLPHLRQAPAPRVVTVSSLAHHTGGRDVVNGNAERAGYTPHHAYSNSKLANLLFATELQRRADQHGVELTSTAAHPGLAATGLPTDPEGLGAHKIVRAAAPVVTKLVAQSARAGALPTLYAATVAEPGEYCGPQRMHETRGPVGQAKRSGLAADERLARDLWRVSEDLTGFRWTW